LAGASLREAFLAGANLADAVLTKVDLDGANLAGADLTNADLTRANLSGANLEGAKLRGAKLRYAQLDSCKLGDADLEGANFSHADLVEAYLGGARARRANFSRAVLQRADLHEAELSSANFEGAMLEGANLSNVRAERSLFSEADLTRAKLVRANFSEADLRRVVLKEATLEGSTLTGARVHGAELRPEQLQDVIAESLDMSVAGDGSQPMSLQDYARGGGAPKQEGSGDRRYFGAGDVMRNAELEFKDNAHVEIQSRFEHCNIQLGKDAELVVGEHGTLEDCTIVGGRLRVIGKFLERRSPGLIGPSQLFVSESGAVSATVKQSGEATHFAFERGCRLRVHIMRPTTDGKAQGN
jgi:uncharacterized protein YjbI with pentapeptide repeats